MKTGTWAGVAFVLLFVLFITARGELPTYFAFFRSAGSTPNTVPGTPESLIAINAAAASSAPLMPGIPLATGGASSQTIPFTNIPGATLGG